MTNKKERIHHSPEFKTEALKLAEKVASCPTVVITTALNGHQL